MECASEAHKQVLEISLQEVEIHAGTFMMGALPDDDNAAVYENLVIR